MKPFKKIDTDRPVQASLGARARIVDTNMMGDFPIVAIITCYNDNDKPYEITQEFDFYGRSHSFVRLYNMPVKREGWINLYGNSATYSLSGMLDAITIGSIHMYDTEDAARQYIENALEYIATVKVEWEDD